jgi:hypothetical protein
MGGPTAGLRMKTQASPKPKKPTPHELHLAKMQAEINSWADDLARVQNPVIKKMIQHNLLSMQLRFVRSQERARVKQATRTAVVQPTPAAKPVVVRKKVLTKTTAFL